MKTPIHSSRITIKYSRKNIRTIEVDYFTDENQTRFVAIKQNNKEEALCLKQSEFMALINELGVLMQTPEFTMHMTTKEYQKDEAAQNKDMVIESTVEE